MAGPLDFTGRSVVATGGSRGLGRVIATTCMDAGADVLTCARSEPDILVTSTDGTREAAFVTADVRDPDQVAAVVAAAVARSGRIAVLVNNAARSRPSPHQDLDALDDEVFDAIMQTNVRGVFATVRAFRALLASDGGGVVVNVSSLAARMAEGSNIAYSASKAALDNMTMSLARALAPAIRVVSVAPGLVLTKFTSTWAPEVRQRQIDRTPLGRLATPEDIGRSILAVATDLTATTGAVVPVDGGRQLG